MKVFLSQQNMRKTISGLLAVWLSGFVFLFCCGIAEAKTTEAEFCPLAKASEHCNKTNQSNDLPTVSSELNIQFNCCGFLAKVFDKFRKIDKTEKEIETSDKFRIERPRFNVAQAHFSATKIFHQPVLIQEKIFIKNCVFRI